MGTEHPGDIVALKRVLFGYVSEGYMTGTTSSFVRDVLTVLRDMPEFNGVRGELDAAVAKMVGC